MTLINEIAGKIACDWISELFTVAFNIVIYAHLYVYVCVFAPRAMLAYFLRLPAAFFAKFFCSKRASLERMTTQVR